jgi:predicted PurR-regulated permease PerM
MFNHIEKIRQKPEHVKRWIAVFITLLLFSIIILVWFWAPDVSLVGKEKSIIDNAPSPFSVLKDKLNDSVNEIGGKFKEFKGQFNDGKIE